MDILVVGIGGNGQTYFMAYLHKKSFRLNHLHDRDGLKHISHPSKLSVQQKKCKIIYVYNKTFEAICSHYRRKWPIVQMRKIKTYNTCQITKVEDFFTLTEASLVDQFGCKDHFLRWYKYDFPNGIYFLNLSKINKNELSNFLKCDKSIFDDLIFDPSKRISYSDLKSKYPLSNIMYTNIDNYMHDLCIYRNQNSIKFN
jgi:hypothetical protein